MRGTSDSGPDLGRSNLGGTTPVRQARPAPQNTERQNAQTAKHHAIFFSKKVIILYFEFLASKATKQNKTKPQEALMKTINSTF
jgi:hypothetical protein